jgi:hypothetical protein
MIRVSRQIGIILLYCTLVAIGPKRHLVRRGDMSGVGGEPDSTSVASFGRE